MSRLITQRPGHIWEFPATVDEAGDGDSLHCHVLMAPDEEEHGVNVRIEGINAIELNRPFGKEARDAMTKLVPSGTAITLLCRRREKYGRLMGRVIRYHDGEDVGSVMLTLKASDGTTLLAVPYLM